MSEQSSQWRASIYLRIYLRCGWPSSYSVAPSLILPLCFLQTSCLSVKTPASRESVQVISAWAPHSATFSSAFRFSTRPLRLFSALTLRFIPSPRMFHTIRRKTSIHPSKPTATFLEGAAHPLTALRLRVQSNLHRLPSTTGRFRKISGLSLAKQTERKTKVHISH